MVCMASPDTAFITEFLRTRMTFDATGSKGQSIHWRGEEKCRWHESKLTDRVLGIMEPDCVFVAQSAVCVIGICIINYHEDLPSSKEKGRPQQVVQVRPVVRSGEARGCSQSIGLGDNTYIEKKTRCAEGTISHMSSNVRQFGKHQTVSRTIALILT